MLRKISRTTLFTLVLSMMLISLHYDVQAADVPRQILIINSYHPGYRWSDNEVEGILSVLSEDDVVTIEYMDTKRIESEAYLEQLVYLYSMKYADEKFDLIFTLDDRAYQLMLDNHDAIFPDTPVVFVGVNDFISTDIESIPWITGTVETFDYSKLLSLISYLIPECKTVYVVTDSTFTGLAYRTQLRKLQDKYTLALPLEFIGDFEQGLRWEELLDEISKLPTNSAILYMSYTRDIDGKVLDIVEATDHIAQASNVPVFVDHTQLHRSGVIGGLVKDPFQEGVTAGEMGVEILEGKTPAQIPIKLEANTIYQFDYNAMATWDIPMRSIPKNSIILNEPPVNMVVNRTIMIWGIILVFFQTSLIILLISINRRRKIAEVALRDEQLNLEQKVKERTHELQEALNVKNRFLANMSHELRTPLTAIIGFSELMLTQTKTSGNERFEKSLNHIHRSGEHLLSLINEILTMAKVSADQIELTPMLVKSRRLLQDTVMMIEGKAIQKGVKVVVDHDPYIQDLWLDEQRIRQVLIILLDNAIKFSHEKSVVKLGLNMRVSDTNQVVFSVQDHGIGIAESDHERIFEPFVQADNELSRSFEGSGLGLTLALQLVELHGGSIEVQSLAGEGTTMSVVLPESTIQPEFKDSPSKEELETTPIPGQQQKSYKVLLAEDNPDTTELITEYLSHQKYILTTAKDGRQVLELVRKGHFDLLLLDLHLPKVGGFEIIRKVRAMENFSETPILVISALVFDEEIQQCFDLGADAFLQKPFSLHDLRKNINRLLL